MPKSSSVQFLWTKGSYCGSFAKRRARVGARPPWVALRALPMLIGRRKRLSHVLRHGLRFLQSKITSQHFPEAKGESMVSWSHPRYALPPFFPADGEVAGVTSYALPTSYHSLLITHTGYAATCFSLPPCPLPPASASCLQLYC